MYNAIVRLCGGKTAAGDSARDASKNGMLVREAPGADRGGDLESGAAQALFWALFREQRAGGDSRISGTPTVTITSGPCL